MLTLLYNINETAATQLLRPSTLYDADNVEEYRRAVEESLKLEAQRILTKRAQALAYKQIAPLDPKRRDVLTGVRLATDKLTELTSVEVTLVMFNTDHSRRANIDDMKHNVRSVILALFEICSFSGSAKASARCNK